MKTLTTSVALIATLFLPLTSMAGQTEIDQIEQAASSLNIKQLSQYSETFNGYDKALGLYRLGLSHNLMGQQAKAKPAIDQSISILESLEQTDPDNVEVKALLAQVYGYKVSLEPLKGAYYGIKSGKTIEQAESLAPNNPRVMLVKGIGKLNTPEMFGGSIEVAKASFEKAIAGFEDDQYSDYHWGEAEAYTWLGMVEMQQGDAAKAKANWKQALVINPNYGWAKMLLAQNQ